MSTKNTSARNNKTMSNKLSDSEKSKRRSPSPEGEDAELEGEYASVIFVLREGVLLRTVTESQTDMT